MPVTPAWNSAALTSGRRSGRTIVVMSFITGKATPGPACCQRNCASIARFDVQRFLCHGAPPAIRAHNVASNAQIRCHGAIGPSELPTSQTLPFVTAHGTVEPLLRPGGLYACGKSAGKRWSGHAGVRGGRRRGSRCQDQHGGRDFGWGHHSERLGRRRIGHARGDPRRRDSGVADRLCHDFRLAVLHGGASVAFSLLSSGGQTLTSVGLALQFGYLVTPSQPGSVYVA